MTGISRVAMFGKLNSLGYGAMHSATSFCRLRGNPTVELVHWINQLLQVPDSDIHHIIDHFRLDVSRIAIDVQKLLDQLPRGATSVSDFSGQLENALERGWTYSTLMFGESQIRTGHLIVGMLKTTGLRGALLEVSGEFAKVVPEELSEGFSTITAGSPEEAMVARDGTRIGGDAAEGAAGDQIAPAAMGRQEALARFSVDLTERARMGELDPVFGRDEEIRQIIDVLMRRRQNNPILTGEAGVGKTAVVEGFAQRIASGQTPPPLQHVTLRVLDIGLLQAGAGVRGEFENRLRSVIDEVQASAKPIILFIDEAHTLIGAGGPAGTGDAANMLKPALARGTLRTIAATTWSEYKKYFEQDPALTRRFQPIQVDEPDETSAIRMMRGVAGVMERHHRVQIMDEALEAAVKLSRRYIPARQLPDKAVSLLDTAAARVAISQHSVPAEVDDSRSRIEALEQEIAILRREAAIGMDSEDRIAGASAAMASERERLAGLEARWEEEKSLVDQVLDLRAELRESAQPDEAPSTAVVELRSGLKELQRRLTGLQGELPLILPSVDAQAVSSVVADWTGIPVGRMVSNEIETVLKLADTLERRVVGQRDALDTIARRIHTSRARLDNPDRPVGVFMLVGPSGVGKTETALVLAEALYGGEQNVITINMSEFQEAHTVSTLKGAPPGYVGYGQGGVLTEAVRRRPYSVVLLDEVEKAHPDVHEIFFQVFDKGRMEDGEGRRIDFRNTLILLTSNVGSDLIMKLCSDPETMPDAEGMAKALREPLLSVFPPALLGRMVIAPYYPLSDEVISSIIRLQLDRIVKRLDEGHGATLVCSDDLIKLIADRCNEAESGGRMIDAILTNTVLPRISTEILTRQLEGRSIRRIELTAADGDFAYAFD
jgi:type VI secretion system protein VasG